MSAGRFHAHFDLLRGGRLEVQSEGRLISERSLREHRGKIEKEFLVPISGYGAVVLRANKDRFIKEVSELREEVATFSREVKGGLQAEMKRSRDALVAALLPGVERSPPRQVTRAHGPNPPEAVLRRFLEAEIDRVIGSVESITRQMEVKLVFKDVAYESLVDDSFLAKIRRALPDVEFLHDEFSAAPGSGR